MLEHPARAFTMGMKARAAMEDSFDVKKRALELAGHYRAVAGLALPQ